MCLPCRAEQRGSIRMGQAFLGRPSSSWIFRSLQEPSGVPSKVTRSLTPGVGASVPQEIQSLLINWKGPDLTIYGELVLEGTFRLHRVRSEKTFFLFDKALLITKKRGDHFVYKGHIPVTRLPPPPLLPPLPVLVLIIPKSVQMQLHPSLMTLPASAGHFEGLGSRSASPPLSLCLTALSLPTSAPP